MTTAVVSVLVGLLIVILVVGTPYWLTHRHMHLQNDPGEALAYQQATARSAGDIAAGKPGRAFRRGGRRPAVGRPRTRASIRKPASPSPRRAGRTGRPGHDRYADLGHGRAGHQPGPAIPSGTDGRARLWTTHVA